MTSTSDKKKNYQVVSDLVAEAKLRNARVRRTKSKHLSIDTHHNRDSNDSSNFQIAFFPEACDYLADNKKDIVAFAESLDGPTVSAYKRLASEHAIWLSLGGLHEKVECLLGTDRKKKLTRIGELKNSVIIFREPTATRKSSTLTC